MKFFTEDVAWSKQEKNFENIPWEVIWINYSKSTMKSTNEGLFWNRDSYHEKPEQINGISNYQLAVHQRENEKILIIVKIYHWSLNTQKVLWSDLAEEAQISEMWTNQYIEDATSFLSSIICDCIWLVKYLREDLIKTVIKVACGKFYTRRLLSRSHFVRFQIELNKSPVMHLALTWWYSCKV